MALLAKSLDAFSQYLVIVSRQLVLEAQLSMVRFLKGTLCYFGELGIKKSSGEKSSPFCPGLFGVQVLT